MGSENHTIIPVIDWNDFPAQSASMVQACEEWGMFRIANIEEILPVSLMLEMKRVTRSLMELPEENKRRNSTDIAIVHSGYFPPEDDFPYYDSLGLYDMASSQAVDSFCNNICASPEQRDIVLKYNQALERVIIDVGSKLGEAVGLKHFSVQGWPALMRITRYRFSPHTIGSPGLPMHTDTGFFTLLQDDDTYGGLQVMDKSGTFQFLDPVPGTFLVVIGDLGAAWSNGRLRNVKHQVVCKEAGLRVSIVTFLLGPKDAPVEIPDEFVNTEHPRLYVPIRYDYYRQVCSSKGWVNDEGLELFRVDAKN